MLKRNLWKRALPLILAAAVTFQSVPVTALAAEGQPAEEAVQDENAGSDSVDGEAGEAEDVSGADAAQGAGDVGDVSDSDAAQGAGEAEDVSDADSVQDAGDEPGADSAQESGEAGDVPDSDAAQDAGDASVSDPAQDVGAPETAPDGEVSGELVAKIVVDDGKVDEFANGEKGFTRVLGAEGLVFFTEYVEPSRCSAFQDAIKDCLSVEVDGENMDTLKDKLTYRWVKKAENVGGG